MRPISIKFSVLAVFLVFGLGKLHAQEVSASGGDHFENSEVKLSYTIGEAVVATVGNDSNTLTQGFHQTKLTVVGLEELMPSVSVRVYPNPTSEFLTIDFGKMSGQFDLILLDINGRYVSSEQLTVNADAHQMNLGSIAAGNYMLNVISKKDINLRNTYKIIKTD